MSDFLSTSETGLRLGVTGRRIQELAKAGHIPSVRIGRCIRIPRPAYEAWLATKTAEALNALRGTDHAA